MSGTKGKGISHNWLKRLSRTGNWPSYSKPPQYYLCPPTCLVQWLALEAVCLWIGPFIALAGVHLLNWQQGCLLIVWGFEQQGCRVGWIASSDLGIPMGSWGWRSSPPNHYPPPNASDIMWTRINMIWVCTNVLMTMSDLEEGRLYRPSGLSLASMPWLESLMWCDLKVRKEDNIIVLEMYLLKSFCAESKILATKPFCPFSVRRLSTTIIAF